MTEAWIGFAAVVGPAILVGIFFWLRFKAKRDMQDTIRTALDKGQELTPELIDRLGHPKEPKDKDMRLAVIWLAIASALVLAGFAVPAHNGEAFRAMLTGAAFPFTIGVAYLILHKFTDRG